MGLKPCAFQPRRTKSRPSSPRHVLGDSWLNSDGDRPQVTIQNTRLTCFLLGCGGMDCAGLGGAPGKLRSLRACGTLRAKWARSWAAYRALWRRRIVTSPRPRPFSETERVLSFPSKCGDAWLPSTSPAPVLPSPHRTLGAARLGRYILTTVCPRTTLSSWIICRPRPTPQMSQWGKAVPTPRDFWYYAGKPM